MRLSWNEIRARSRLREACAFNREKLSLAVFGALYRPQPSATSAALDRAQIAWVDRLQDGSHIGNYAMHIITRARLAAFRQQHADAAPQLHEWVRIMRRKRYTKQLQVKSDFPTADFVGPRKVVFNICGNAYRLVVDMRYDLGRIYIGHVATHAEYDRLIRRKRL